MKWLKLVEKIERRDRAAVSQSKLQIQQSDPHSPLYSSTTFEGLELKKELLDGIFKVGYQKPSHIQEIAIPTILKKPDQHFIGQAQAGTGKTAAFALSALARINTELQQPQVLVLCPTRELALQIVDVFTGLSQLMTGVGILGLVKDAVIPDKITQQILVGPPGTVNDASRRRKFDPKKLTMVVIDEADQMIQPPSNTKDNMWPQTQAILKTAPQAQICLFSATFPSVVMETVDKLLSAPAAGSTEPRHYTKITLAPEEQSLDQIHEFYFVCQPEQKFEALKKIFKAATLGSTVIFVNTKKGSNELQAALHKEGYEVSVLHGDLTPTERDSTMRNFRESKIRMLIVTNMFARGINIPEITTVVNYEMPYIYKGQNAGPSEGDAASYLHRIGRSGRFGADGTAISFTATLEERDALKSINAELAAVNKETGKAKRKREIKKLTLEDLTPFTKILDEIAEAAA
jgi:ATP-dependent RNA helicase DDX19/DBP5